MDYDSRWRQIDVILTTESGVSLESRWVFVVEICRGCGALVRRIIVAIRGSSKAC